MFDVLFTQNILDPLFFFFCYLKFYIKVSAKMRLFINIVILTKQGLNDLKNLLAFH